MQISLNSFFIFVYGIYWFRHKYHQIFSVSFHIFFYFIIHVVFIIRQMFLLPVHGSKFIIVILWKMTFCLANFISNYRKMICWGHFNVRLYVCQMFKHTYLLILQAGFLTGKSPETDHLVDFWSWSSNNTEMRLSTSLQITFCNFYYYCIGSNIINDQVELL